MSTIVLRSVKGSPLTNAEVDSNFSNLNTDKLEAATTATLTNKTINLASNTLVATSAQIAAAVTDETGTGALVFANSPTLVTPALGTPASGVVTNLTGTASININGTVGATTANTGAFTTLTTSSTVTHNGGTANGVAFLNGSKVLTTGSALTFDGTSFGVGGSTTRAVSGYTFINAIGNSSGAYTDYYAGATRIGSVGVEASLLSISTNGNLPITFAINDAEQMRLNSTGLGIGTSAPTAKLDVREEGTSGVEASLANFFAGSTAGLRVFVTPSGSGTGSITRFYAESGGSFDTSSIIAFDTRNAGTRAERMRITSAGNVGIGTNSPAAKLHVAGTSTQQALVQSTNGGTTSLQLLNSAVSSRVVKNVAGALVFEKDAVDQATLDASGNLGLGVTPSAWRSSTKALQSTAGAIYDFSTTGKGITQNAFLKEAPDAWAYVNNGHAAQLDIGSGQFAFYTAASGTAGDAISFTQAMTLDASGRLGLNGVTSPVAPLHVGGTSGLLVRIGTTSGNGSTNFWPVEIGDGDSTGGGTNQNFLRLGRFSDGTAGVDAFQAGVGNAALAFGTFGTERARIDSSGNLLVGTTTAYGRVVGKGTGAASPGMVAICDTVSIEAIGVWSQATSGDNLLVNFGTEGTFTSRGSITYNRTAGLVAYNTTSDYRAKDIIGPVIDSGALIDSTPVYMGKMKGATQERPMFIAHEVPAYAHTGEKDAVDADGKPVYQQMDASALIPVMWAEIQSLRARLAAANI
jgi:hypothetical protein